MAGVANVALVVELLLGALVAVLEVVDNEIPLGLSSMFGEVDDRSRFCPDTMKREVRKAVFLIGVVELHYLASSCELPT